MHFKVDQYSVPLMKSGIQTIVSVWVVEKEQEDQGQGQNQVNFVGRYCMLFVCGIQEHKLCGI